MSILGNRVLRTEDPRFLTVGGTYAADLREPALDGAVYAAFVRSTIAHGRLLSIDAAEARSAPGVVAVVTAAELDLGPTPPPVPFLNQGMPRPPLATDTVRFVGEPIAVVLAESPAQAADAAELVFADYEPLPVVTDPEQAANDTVLLFPEAGTNCAVELDFGRADDLFEGCEVVVRARLVNQRVAACPLEGRSAAAAWMPDGRLHAWVSVQAPHEVRGGLAAAYGLEPEQVRDRDEPRGARAAGAGQAHRAARAVARDPQREHGRHGPRPGTDPDRGDGRPP
jgi:carbon-monoxide dehydrogenase large subunit